MAQPWLRKVSSTKIWICPKFAQAAALRLLGSFLSGDAGAIVMKHIDTSSFAIMAATLSVMLPCVVISGIIVSAIHGIPKKTKLMKLTGKNVPMYAIIVSMLVLEEVFARQIFLGWIGRLFSGSAALYALFFVGNSAWALIHLFNYQDPQDRKLLRVAPQFVGGIFLTVIFLQYGFLAGLLVHIAFDMLIFCMNRRNIFDAGEIKVIGYNAAQLAVGVAWWAYTGNGFPELVKWFLFDGSYMIDSWSLWDYAVAIMSFSALLSIVADLLLYDVPRADKIYSMVETLSASSIFLAMILVVFMLAGFVTETNIEQFIVVGLVLAALALTNSGSGLSRVFWFVIPANILAACAIFAIDAEWWRPVALFAIVAVSDMPERALRFADKT